MVESLVLRLRQLRAALTAAWQRLINGQRPKAAMAMMTDVSTAAFDAERTWRKKQGEGFRIANEARKTLLVNALLIAGMIASAIYAPVSPNAWIVWGLCSTLAAALDRRGVNWIAAWRDASLKLTGW